MKGNRKSDVVWSWILIICPSICLLASVIPGMIWAYDPVVAAYRACGLLNVPDNTVLSNLAPLLLLSYAYTVLLGVIYSRNQGLGTLKAVFVFHITNTVLTLFGLIPRNVATGETMIKPMPYILLCAVFALGAILAFIRLKKEEDRYEFD